MIYCSDLRTSSKCAVIWMQSKKAGGFSTKTRLLTRIPNVPSLAKSIRLIGRSKDQFVTLNTEIFSSYNWDL